MWDTFSSHLNQNNLTGLAGGVREGQNMAQNAACAVNPMQKSWLRSPGEAPKWLKDTRNGPETISPIYLSLFPGSLTYLGASTGLRSQQFCIGFTAQAAFLAIFWPSLTPPANPVKLFWFKMTWKGVPHIVLHVLCSTRTSGGYLRPSEVRFRAILALSDDLF